MGRIPWQLTQEEASEGGGNTGTGIPPTGWSQAGTRGMLAAEKDQRLDEQIGSGKFLTQLRPRLHGNRCRTPKTRALSCASTDSGPPSPVLSVHFSPPSKAPMAPLVEPDAPLEMSAVPTAGAMVTMSAVSTHIGFDMNSAAVKSKETLSDALRFKIHMECKSHPRDEPVLRVRGTFVEYWEPPLISPTTRRSRSTGASPAALLLTAQIPLFGMPEAATPAVPSRSMPPADSPPCFQSFESLPSPTFEVGANASYLPPPEVSVASMDTLVDQPIFWQPQMGKQTWPKSSNDWLFEQQFYGAPTDSAALPWIPWTPQEATQEPTNFYGFSAQPQLPPGPGPGWTFNNDVATFAGYNVSMAFISSEPMMASSMQEVPSVLTQPGSAWNHNNDVAICEDQEVPLDETIDLLCVPSQAGHEPSALMSMQESSSLRSSGGDQHRAGRRVSNSRKAPSSNEQVAVNIIRAARMASTEPKYSHQGPSIWELSCKDKHTSANVQAALEIAANTGYESNCEDGWSDAWLIVGGLQGHVCHAYDDSSANYVLSKVFEVMPAPLVSCIAEELKGHAVEAAKHRFGCRCMVRLIRFHAVQCAADESVAQVIHELCGAAGSLSRAQFGTHVIQELFNSGLPEHHAAVVQALRPTLHRDSKNRFAGRVVEMAVSKCCTGDVNAMMDTLLSGNDSIHQLVNNEFGARVVKALLGSKNAKRAAGILCSVPAEVATSRSGKQLLQEARGILASSETDAVWQQGRGRSRYRPERFMTSRP